MIPPLALGQGAKPTIRPNFDGIWNSATATPLERPAQLKDKAFFTAEEAEAWERQVAGRNEEPSPEAAAKKVGTGTGTYNTFFREFGTRTVKTLRTSIVTDPPDGRIPALTLRRRGKRALQHQNPRARRNGAAGSLPGDGDDRPPMLP